MDPELSADALERLRRLADFAALLQDPGFDFGHWAGGERQPDGVITMPYYELSMSGRALVAALPVIVFEWPRWMESDEAQALIADHARVAHASEVELVKLTTCIVRGERFSDGTLEWAYRTGLIAAIVRRAALLSREGRA